MQIDLQRRILEVIDFDEKKGPPSPAKRMSGIPAIPSRYTFLNTSQKAAQHSARERQHVGMDLPYAHLTELRACLLNDAGGLPLRPHPKPPVPDLQFQFIRISTGLELL